jgi:hypothetical protein
LGFGGTPRRGAMEPAERAQRATAASAAGGRQALLDDNATLLDTLVGLARLQVHEGRGFPAPSSAGGEQQSVATPHRT